jgi:hypothetical protein
MLILKILSRLIFYTLTLHIGLSQSFLDKIKKETVKLVSCFCSSALDEIVQNYFTLLSFQGTERRQPLIFV